MHIVINDKTMIADIEKAFSDFYPYLEIHFYRTPHIQYKGSPDKERISSDIPIAAIKKNHIDGVIEILPQNKVQTIENELYERFGLTAQILRKEKDLLVQTTVEDDFTLKDLNMFGRNSSDEYILEEEDIDPGQEKPEKLF
jgi:hypothetical protein